MIHGACRQCQYYVGIEGPPGPNGQPYGNCVRFPPQVLFVNPDIVNAMNNAPSVCDPIEPYYQTRWPVVSHNDCCGEFVQNT
jgi:hypothetical protein